MVLGRYVVVVVVVVEMNIIKDADHHFCISAAGPPYSQTQSVLPGRWQFVAGRHIVSQPERTTGTTVFSSRRKTGREGAYSIRKYNIMMIMMTVTTSTSFSIGVNDGRDDMSRSQLQPIFTDVLPDYILLGVILRWYTTYFGSLFISDG